VVPPQFGDCWRGQVGAEAVGRRHAHDAGDRIVRSGCQAADGVRDLRGDAHPALPEGSEFPAACRSGEDSAAQRLLQGGDLAGNRRVVDAEVLSRRRELAGA
jgi:hypothetical protein